MEQDTKQKQTTEHDTPKRAKELYFPSYKGQISALVLGNTYPVLFKKDYAFIKQYAEKADCVIFLGDIKERQLKKIKKLIPDNMPQFGIMGELDHPWLYDKYHIDNIHTKKAVIKGLVFAGFEGTCRYKNKAKGRMFTETESEEICHMIPPCDILLTHDLPKTEEDYEDKLHKYSGIIGVGSYLKAHKRTRFHLWCHSAEHTEKYYVPYCKSICVNKYRMIKIDKYGIS